MERANELLGKDVGTLVSLLFRCMYKLPFGHAEVAAGYLAISTRCLSYMYMSSIGLNCNDPLLYMMFLQ